MPYSGPGQLPYWTEIQNNGSTSNAGMQSEQVPVVVGSTYNFTATLSYAATYAPGASITLAIFSSVGVQLAAAAGATVTNMTGGQNYTANSGTVTAPAGASYAVATVTQAGLPAVSNILSVFQGLVSDQTGTAVNANYAFTWNYWPWSALSNALLSWNYNPVLPGDFDSLVLDGQIELMGGTPGVPCTIPALLDSNGAGPRFRLLAPPSGNSAALGYQGSYDLNAPQPTQDVVASMLLDGERPFGSRASNRQMSLPIVIFGTEAGGMAQVLAAREYLMAIIDQQSWSIRWTSADTGLPMLFDCFRALPSVPVYGFNYSAGGSATQSEAADANYPIGLITLTIQALPYGKSDVDGAQDLLFTNGLVSGPSLPGAVTVDNFTSFNAGANPDWAQDSVTYSPLGGTSVRFQSPSPVKLPYTAAAYASSMAGSVSVAGLPTLSVWFGQVYDGRWVPTPAFKSNVTLNWTLTDNHGNKLRFSSVQKGVRWATDIRNPYWTQLNTAIPQNSPRFNYAAVASYALQVTNSAASATPGYARMHCWLNSVLAQPQTITNPASPRGAVYNLFGLPGSARAPISVQAQLPAAVPVTREFTAAGLGTWPVPGGVYNVAAECWAGGGAGASTGSYGALVLEYNPVLYAPLSANANDASGNGFNGTATAVTFSQDNSGLAGQHSALFNGTTSGITFPVNPYGAKTMTISAWFNGNGTAPVGRLIASSHTDSGTDKAGFELYANSSHQLVAAFGSGTANAVATAGSTLPSSGWHHGAATYDGTTVTLYLDGASVATASLSGAVAPGFQNLVSVGYGAYGPSDFFAGLIEGAAIMNEALTAAQVTVLAASGAAIGGGGAGGEYAAEPSLAVTPGTKVPWSVGAGGTPAQLSPTVISFTKAGVVSHWLCPAGVTSVLVEDWGAGAAGAAGAGGGGAGEYAAQVFSVTPGVTYWIYAGAGGVANSGTSSASNSSRAGQDSWFGNSGTKNAAGALLAAHGGKSPLTGATPGGQGGSGSTAPVHHNGGNGGASPGTGGGGGGGAGGNAGAGGNGGDSPATSAFGRLAGGGTGGTGSPEGNSSGGNGGNGSPAPGFPARGLAPGGGGGGGYSGPVIFRTIQPAGGPLVPDGNYLGADGADGEVQLSYSVSNGAAVNGGTTSFGSAGTTGTTVTAHGGASAAANSEAATTGGAGSSNTVHSPGGIGGLYTSGPQGSWYTSPFTARTSTAFAFQLGGSGTYVTASGTSSTAAASCAQGVSVVLVRSRAAVSDLTVTDTSGNLYTLAAQQAGGSAHNGITTYAFTANIANPVTTATTITITSGTAQAYGYLWYTSPTLSTGVSAPNQSSNAGTGSTITGTFGAGDQQSMQYELIVMSNDAGATPSGGQPSNNNTMWFAPNATSSATDSAGIIQAFVALNQGGGTALQGAAGDAFSCGMSASSNWSLLCVPLVAAAQDATAVKLARVNGTTPGASTNWANGGAISANGTIAVMGISLSAAPTGIVDVSGNAYAQRSNVQTAGFNAHQWIFTAPVTAALPQGSNGTVHWGGASASPQYMYDVYWLPNATGLDSALVTSVTGTGTAVSGSYQPFAANDQIMAMASNFLPSAGVHLTPAGSRPGAPWNYVDFDNAQANLSTDLFLAQGTDNQALSVTGAYPSAVNWALSMVGFTQAPLGNGGGAAGGASGTGYPAMSSLGAPGYAGGAHGGNGAQAASAPGGNGALPGGGGGGAYSSVFSTSTFNGGAGGQGLIRITWQPPLTPFNTLILHRPGETAPPNFSPLVPIPVTDIPNNTEYTIAVPSQVPYLNAEFDGTYTVLAAAYAWNAATAGSVRTLTVSINQYEYPGGPRYSVQASRAVTPAIDVVNGIVNLGEVTLPLKDYAAHNDQSYFTVSISDSDQGDSFQDVLFLDTRGQTVLINIAPGTPGYGQYVSYYVDEPPADRAMGFVGATTGGRQRQVSVLEYAMPSGGPLYIMPGDNLLLAYSPAGAPNIGVRYAPRWYLDRTQ